MKLTLDSLMWDVGECRDGLQGFAVEAGLPIRDVVLPRTPPSAQWIERACQVMGLELETVQATMSELEGALDSVAPGFLLFFADRRLLFVVSSKRGRLTLLSASMRRVVVRTEALAAMLRTRYEVPVALPAFLEGMGIEQRAYARAMDEKRAEHMPAFAVSSMRIGTTQPFLQELRHSSFGYRLAGAGVLLGLQSLLSIGATVLLAQQAVSGRIDSGRILGWGLALVTQTLLQGLLGQVVGHMNIELATSMKRRLVDGALSLEPDFVRQVGIGANLSVAAESATIDQLSIADFAQAISSGLLFLTAFGFLAVQDPVSGVVLLGFVLLSAYLTRHFYKVSTTLTALRIKLTDLFVERVLGHHTRLVQLPRSRWHEGEDENLHAYVEEAGRLDNTQTWVELVPRAAMLVLAFLQLRLLAVGSTRYLVLVPLVAGYAATQALSQVLGSLQRLIRWPVSLRALLPILSRSTLGQNEVSPTELPDDDVADDEVLLEASGLRFGYHPMRPPVLNGLELKIRAGDHILVTGPSGGGKSTLAALLTALRRPTAGLVMLRGLDQHSVSGPEWRRQVVSAPQFHENYIFQNTLAFNLLMGRKWPPIPPDLVEAETVCRELGLGALLDNMPAGIQQVVGETGWRLSHGERSRVFIARALLQNADVLIFDESFGALDPETLELAMLAVRSRARTLLVISHK